MLAVSPLFAAEASAGGVEASGITSADTADSLEPAAPASAARSAAASETARTVFPPNWRSGAWLAEGQVFYLREAIAPLSLGTSYSFTTLGYSLPAQGRLGSITPSFSVELPLIGMTSYDGVGSSVGIGNLLVQGALRRDRALKRTTLGLAFALGVSLPVGGWTGVKTHASFVDPNLTHPNLPAYNHFDQADTDPSDDDLAGLAHVPATFQLRVAGKAQGIGLELKVPLYPPWQVNSVPSTAAELFVLSLEYQRRLNDRLYLQTSITTESARLGHIGAGLWYGASQAVSMSFGLNVPLRIEDPSDGFPEDTVPVQPVFSLWYRL